LAQSPIFADRPVNAVSDSEILLPDFARQIDAAQALEIVHGRGMSGAVTLSFKRTPEGWVMRERDDYPARQELVNETLLALGSLQTGAARTAQPKWHRALGLVPPEEFGKAIRFRVRNAEGGLLADVMLGKEEASEVAAVQQIKQLGTVERNFYVRRTDSAQTWLARGRLPRNAQIGAWLDPTFPSLPQEGLIEVRSGGKGSESSATEPLVQRLPDGSWNKLKATRWLEGFTRLQPEDASRDTAINFDTASTLHLSYDTGLTLVLENVGAATALWTRARATVSNSALNAPQDDAGRQAARALADALNQRFNGWALRLPASAAAQLLVSAADFGD
jgi:hypothetical protein